MGKPAPEHREKTRPVKPKCYFCHQPLEGPMMCYLINTPDGLAFSHVESETHHVPVEIRRLNVVNKPDQQPLHLWLSTEDLPFTA
jgi:hypothetical protein